MHKRKNSARRWTGWMATATLIAAVAIGCGEGSPAGPSPVGDSGGRLVPAASYSGNPPLATTATGRRANNNGGSTTGSTSSASKKVPGLVTNFTAQQVSGNSGAAGNGGGGLHGVPDPVRRRRAVTAGAWWAAVADCWRSRRMTAACFGADAALQEGACRRWPTR